MLLDPLSEIESRISNCAWIDFFQPALHRPPKVQGLSVDETGKVHGALPRVQDLYRMTRQALEETRDALTESIETRKAELIELGEHGPHRARVGAEESLLRSLDKILGDLRGGGSQ